MGYAIQIGAFKHLSNAEKLTHDLEQKGCEAYYFRHSSGIYKVRSGNYSAYTAAKSQAQQLKSSGIIDSFYIVPPSSYPVAKRADDKSLREEIVLTARNYKGIPYRWGGTSVRTGFDCSGLAMAVYRLNGLNLPRTSREQFKAGRSISRLQLKKGDLVFFATGNTRKVTHVGIYTGRGRFIHAPGKGKKIRTDKLTDDYYLSTYAGARSFL
ncbi:MAG: C40 family peptidase [Deltaproteobacteria bacterium]|nr:C40 family peptidase [Deltaproteobacteria bacterium]